MGQRIISKKDVTSDTRKWGLDVEITRIKEKLQDPEFNTPEKSQQLKDKLNSLIAEKRTLK
jgi:hypothetical protein